MSVQPFARLPQPGALEASSLWIAMAAGAGALLGATSTISPTAALALATAIALMVWVIARPGILLTALIASVFVQVIAVGGVTIGRICAPIAVVVVAVTLLRGTATLQPAAPLAWVVGYTLWALASGLWTTNLGGTATQLASLGIGLSYMLAFATLLNNRRDVARILYTFAIVAFAVG